MAPALGPPVNPCELHCRPANEYFAEKLRDAVIDGTPCYQGQPGHDLCINGICKVCLSPERVSHAGCPGPPASPLAPALQAVPWASQLCRPVSRDPPPPRCWRWSSSQEGLTPSLCAMDLLTPSLPRPSL